MISFNNIKSVFYEVGMDKYYYCVNTFQNSEPVQEKGYIEAESEEDAIRKLINEGIVYPRGYEFLELYVV